MPGSLARHLDGRGGPHPLPMNALHRGCGVCCSDERRSLVEGGVPSAVEMPGAMSRHFEYPPVRGGPHPLLRSAVMSTRKLKHWGWGYEDQVPSREELEQAAAGIRERFGFGEEPEEPVPLDEVDLRKPRLKVPSAFGELFRDDHYERVSHSLGKATGMWCGGFGGSLRIRRIWWRFLRTSLRLRLCLVGLRPRGRRLFLLVGDQCGGGVEARVGERPVVSLDLRRLDRVLEVDARVAGGSDSGWGYWAGAGGSVA